MEVNWWCARGKVVALRKARPHSLSRAGPSTPVLKGKLSPGSSSRYVKLDASCGSYKCLARATGRVDQRKRPLLGVRQDRHVVTIGDFSTQCYPKLKLAVLGPAAILALFRPEFSFLYGDIHCRIEAIPIFEQSSWSLDAEAGRLLVAVHHQLPWFFSL